LCIDLSKPAPLPMPNLLNLTHVALINAIRLSGMEWLWSAKRA
jgi:hypothetical protein